MNGGAILISFSVWMLLTGVWSWANAALGVVAAVVSSFFFNDRFSALRLIGVMFAILVRVPLALWESVVMIVRPHRYERLAYERVEEDGDAWKRFARVLVTTFTPKSLVVGEENTRLRIHSLERKERK